MAFTWLTGFTVDGKVGIGTDDPDGVLEVVTTDDNRYIRFKAPNEEERFQFYTGGTGNASALYMYTSDGTTRNVQISAGGNSYFTAGNVGIGTSGPDAKLEIVTARSGTPSSDANIKVTDSTDQAADVGGSIVFTGKYTDGGTYLSGGPFIRASKKNDTTGDYGYGLVFGVRDTGSATSETAMIINSNGNVGINKATTANATLDVLGTVAINRASPSPDNYQVDIQKNSTNPDVTGFGVRIDADFSGTKTVASDIGQGGIKLDVDSSAIGTITDEHRFYGINNDVRYSGLPDAAWSVYNRLESNGGDGTTTQAGGVLNLIQTDTTADHTNTALYGVLNDIDIQDAGIVSSIYGTRSVIDTISNRTSNVGNIYGSRVDIDLNSSNNVDYGNMFGYFAVIDNNTATATELGTQYLFKGQYDDVRGDDAWGIHIQGDKNYLEGTLGIGTATSDYQLEVALTSGVSLANQPAEPLFVSNNGQSVDGRVFITVKHDTINTASALGAGIKMTAGAVTSGTASYNDSLILVQSAGRDNTTIHSAPTDIEFYVDNHDTAAGAGTDYDAYGDLALTLKEDTTIQFNSYTAGTLISDSDGNITSTTTPPGTGVFLPLDGGDMTGRIQLPNATNLQFIGSSGDHARIFYTQGDGTTGDVWSHNFYQNSGLQAGIEFYAATEALANGNIRFKTGATANTLILNADQDASFAGNIAVGGAALGTDTLTPLGSISFPGNAKLFGYNNSIYNIANAYYDSGWKYLTTNTASVLHINSNGGSGLTFRQAASGTADDTITFTTSFEIDSSGDATFSGTVDAPTFEGNLTGNVTGNVTGNLQGGHTSGTISSGVTAVTQPNATDNTELATTAFVVNKIAELPAGLQFLGTWDADTNTPTLASGGGERSEGTTTTVTTDKLIDSAATFTTAPAVVVGDRVRVVTPAGPEFALVTSVDSATQLTLAADIVTATGEAYIIEQPAFIPEGNYYIVSDNGATDLNGITDWKVGDWVVASSTNVWQKIDNSSVLDGSGTGQKIPLWVGSGTSNTLDNSILTQSGSSIITQTATSVAQYVLNSIADNDSTVRFEQAGVQVAKIGYDHSEGALVFVHGSGAFSTAGMVLDGTGVGIGVTDPGYSPSSLPDANVLLQLGGDNLGDIPELRLAGGNGLDVSSKIVFDNDILGRGMSIFMTSDTTPFGPDGLCFFNENSTDPLTNEGRVIMKMNRDTQNVGIGINDPTSKLHINQTVTDPDLDLPISFAVEIDSNHSGSAATTGDREQGGLYIDVDSSTTGGDTQDEHRLYGINNNVNHSGDSDLVYAISNRVEQNTTTGTTTNVIGGYSAAISDGGSGAVLTNITGVYGSVDMQDATPVSNSYGGQFLNNTNANRTGATTNSFGIRSEIQIGSTSAYTSLFAAHFSIDSNAAYTATNSYLLYLDYAGASLATNTYAIYSANDVKSYHEGNFGIGTDDPQSKLQVAGGIQMADDDVDAVANKAGTMRYRTGTEYVEVTGVDLVTNGDFATDSDWTKGTGWTISGGTASAVSATGELSQTGINFDTSKIYRVGYVISGYSGSGGVKARLKGAVWNTGILREGNGSFTETITSTGENFVFAFVTSSSFTGSIDNVSVMEVTAEDASYADMCMQTGASTYEWVNIVRNTY